MIFVISSPLICPLNRDIALSVWFSFETQIKNRWFFGFVRSERVIELTRRNFLSNLNHRKSRTNFQFHWNFFYFERRYSGIFHYLCLWMERWYLKKIAMHQVPKFADKWRPPLTFGFVDLSLKINLNLEYLIGKKALFFLGSFFYETLFSVLSFNMT